MKPVIESSLENARLHYEQKGILDVFYKKYICVNCKYGNACKGVGARARINCDSFKRLYEPAETKWTEMSHNKFSYSNMNERMRMERSDDSGSWKRRKAGDKKK